MARRNAFADWQTDMSDTHDPNDALPHLKGIPIAKPRAKRSRKWENENPVFSYLIPEDLIEQARVLREEIKSAAQYDQDGKPRADLTTDSHMATIWLEYALEKAKKENLSFSPMVSGRGRMALTWEEAEAGSEPAVMPKPKPRKKKERQRFELAYRWTKEHHQAIQRLAGDVAPGTNSRNPNRYVVPLGEVLLRLLQRASTGYKKRQLRPRYRMEAVQKRALGWDEE